MNPRAIALGAAILFCCGTIAEAQLQWPWSKPKPRPTPALKKAAPPKSAAPKPRATPARPRQPLVALPNYDVETSTRLQIFLDNNNFAPGKIDGEIGEFFRKALLSYKRARGLELTGAVDRALFEQVPRAFTTYTLRPEDVKFVGPMAYKPSEQARLKALPYASLLEFACERFHASEAFIRRLNTNIHFERLKPGDTINVPDVIPFEIEKLSEGFMPENPALAGRKLVVDTFERTLEVRENEKLVAQFPMTPGSKSLPAPAGTWKILGIATLPWFRHDEGVLNHGVRTEDFYNLPAGPNNPVGVLWMGLNKPGIGIHGTNNPETIGRAASHGCIRLANWDAARVKDLVTKNVVVEIL